MKADNIKNIISDIDAIYTTISCARGQADGLAHIPEKL